jgi:predicted ATP-dependent endonuclease of OLD family
LIDYCKTLSRNRQIIIATHSPFVVSSITEGDKLIILKREEDKIMVDLENKYYSIGEVEKVVKSMPIMVEVNKDRIQLLVAGITDQMYLEQTINL